MVWGLRSWEGDSFIAKLIMSFWKSNLFVVSGSIYVLNLSSS